VAEATEEKKDLEKQITKALEYVLEGDDKVAHDFFITRKAELQKARQDVLGVNMETIWRSADKAYVPHQLKTGGKKVFASDDELGWRSIQTILRTTGDWQEDSVSPDPYVKIQTALAILVDRNPKAVFKAAAKKYEQSAILHSELYKRNWEIAHSKEQLRVLVLNGAKYGILTGMTAPLKIQRKVRNLVEFDPKNPNNNKYEEQMVTIYDDVYRWALNPWTCWFDDMAKPGDPYSLNDWMRYKDYSWERFREQFQGLKGFQFVKPKEQPALSEGSDTEQTKKLTRKSIVRLWFYENLEQDRFYIETDDGIVLVNEPIPHLPKNKRLSCWVAPWTLRHQDTIFGIGIYEAMRNDYKVRMKVRNMTIDQLVLSIYKEWFYEGTNTLQGTGEMTIRPGVGRQVTNAKNVVWNQVPGPGAEAWLGLKWIDEQIDNATGITKTLEGELSPNAKAFDIAQARESSLKRMKTPLDSIAFALEQDAYISSVLFEELYSTPEIEKIVDLDKIDKMKLEFAQGQTPAGTQIQEFQDENTGEFGLLRKTFRTFPLNIERDKEGNMMQIKEEKFFSVLPENLTWEGMIQVTGQSIIAESPLLEKQQKLELSNMLIPLFQAPPEIVLPAAKQLLKIYNEDPEDWFPIPWLQFMQGGSQLFTQVPGQTGQQATQTGRPQAQIGQAPQPQTVVPSTQVQPQRSVIQQFLSKINPFQNSGR